MMDDFFDLNFKGYDDFFDKNYCIRSNIINRIS